MDAWLLKRDLCVHMHVSAYVYMKYLIDATIKLEELKLMPLPRYAELWGIAGPRLVTCGV